MLYSFSVPSLAIQAVEALISAKSSGVLNPLDEWASGRYLGSDRVVGSDVW